jgi:hypothetical protein
MEPTDFLRVVALWRGALKAAEFRLRPGETGLSLFARLDHPTPEEIVEAVRSAGKQGELAAAVIPASAIRELGLVLVKTTGGTPVSAVNAVHFEARLHWWRRFVLFLRGKGLHDSFNDRFAHRLYEAAQVLR